MRTVELLFEQLLVGDGLARVEDDQDERARSRRSDDALAATLAVLGALDDTGEVQELDLGALVSCEGR